MGILWVARHGETDWNLGRRLQGHMDPGLNAAGLDQAADLAERLGAELEPATPVVSSDLRRAHETARQVAAALGSQVRTRGDLRERGLGFLEGRTYEEAAKTHPREVLAYRKGTDLDAIPGIEPYADFCARSVAAVRAVAAEHDLAVVVTHGGVLRVLLREACGDKRFMIPNAALFRLRVEDDGFARL